MENIFTKLDYRIQLVVLPIIIYECKKAKGNEIRA